jgi:protocatechuate 3,4-dioxygenase beta subunit
MKSNLVRAALACVALSLPASAAFAGPGDPISSVPIGLEGDPGSIVIAHSVTDGKGQFNFGNLKPGKYRIVLDGKGLALALKRIDPKGLPHTLHLSFGLAGQKPITSSDLPYSGGDAASLSVTLYDDGTGVDENAARKHNYVGTVTLVK